MYTEYTKHMHAVLAMNREKKNHVHEKKILFSRILDSKLKNSIVSKRRAMKKRKEDKGEQRRRRGGDTNR